MTTTVEGPANATAATIVPRLSQAAETYVSMKGAGRPKTFAAEVHRSLRYLVEVAGDKPINTYLWAGANALRDFLRGHGDPLGPNYRGGPIQRGRIKPRVLTYATLRATNGILVRDTMSASLINSGKATTDYDFSRQSSLPITMPESDPCVKITPSLDPATMSLTC